MSHSHAAELPARPDVAQQRKRAKELLAALRAGEAAALARMRASHPRLSRTMGDAAIRSAACLAAAQLVIAREYGFASWPRLRAHIAALHGEAVAPCLPFRTDLQYYRERAFGLRSNHRTGERNALRLIRRLHPAFAEADEGAIRAASITQADAELVLAREHGFPDWDAFAAHVEAIAKGAAAPFRDAFKAIEDDDRPGLARLLDARPALLDACGTNGNRLLTFAVAMHRVAMVDDLLARGADPELANDKGWTALHAAAYGGVPQNPEAEWPAMIGTLVEAGAAVEAEAYGDGGTPLAVALFWGYAAPAERLAAEAIVPDNLRIAAGLGRLDLMASFFDAGGALLPAAFLHREFHRPHSGFPPWRPSDDAQEVLDEALGWAARSDRVAAMAMLLDRGAAIDAEPYNGTALHWAVSRERIEAITWLLDHGADIDRAASFGGVHGVTPLHVAAAWGGRPHAARLLVTRGADCAIRDPQHDSTPLGWAEFFKLPEIAAILEGAA